MRTIFYEHLKFGDPTPAGAVTVEHGVAQIPPELAWINTVPVEDWNTSTTARSSTRSATPRKLQV